MRTKLQGWKAKLLSLAGRVTAKLSVTLCDEIDRVYSDFLWGHDIGITLQRPRSYGGLGIWPMCVMNIDALSKLG